MIRGIGGFTMRPRRRINYSRVMSQVQSLHNLSDKISKEETKVYNVVNDTNGAWNGNSAKRFLDGGSEISIMLGTSSKSIKKLADRIKRVADDIQREDDRRIKEYERKKEREAEERRRRRERSQKKHERSRSK